MSFVSKTVLMIGLLCLPAMVSAITLEEALDYALTHSEAMRINRETSEQLRATGRQATAFIQPQISTTASYTQLDNNVDDFTDTGATSTSDPTAAAIYDYLSPLFSAFEAPERDITAEVTATQVLYAGGRILNSVALKDNLDVQAEQNISSGDRDIRQDVRLAFDGVLFRQASLEILTDRLKQRQAEYEDARDLYEAGAGTSLDVRQAQMSINVALDGLKAGEADLQSALIDFNLAIGRSGAQALLIPEGDLTRIPDMPLVVRELQDRLEGDDFLDIDTLKTQVAAADLNYQITGGQRYPEVALFTSAKTTGDQYDEMDEYWSLGVQFSFDLWDGGLVRAEKAEAGAQLRSAKESLVKAKKKMAGAVESLGINIESTAKRIELQKQATELARENYEDARGQYRAGILTLTRLGEFNLYSAEARFNLIRLYYAQRQLLTQALAILGR